MNKGTSYWRPAWETWPRYSPGKQCAWQCRKHPLGACLICEVDKPVMTYEDLLAGTMSRQCR